MIISTLHLPAACSTAVFMRRDRERSPQTDPAVLPTETQFVTRTAKFTLAAVAVSTDGYVGARETFSLMYTTTNLEQCGNTPAHCGTGCLSGCANTAPGPPVVVPSVPAGAAPRPDGRCGKEFGGATCNANGEFGGCCRFVSFRIRSRKSVANVTQRVRLLWKV